VMMMPAQCHNGKNCSEIAPRRQGPRETHKTPRIPANFNQME
jgi:hypothetical protein